MNALYGIITSSGVGLLIFLLGSYYQKKKNRVEIDKLKAEVEGQELSNIDRAVKIWRELAEGLERTVDDLREECHKLREEVKQLRTENYSLKSDIKKLKSSIDNNNNK